MPLKIEVGQKVQLRKNHPCGGNIFTVMRTGMDFRIKCETCDTQLWMSRKDFEKRVKKVIEAGDGEDE